MAVATDPPDGCEVLLLEDDSVLRRRLVAHLRSLGAEVTEVSNLGEARNALAGLRFDFALVDLHLPDGDALELLREGAFSENTGVVVMTAFGE
jgi:DNA-binding response OmpR family regulator